MSSIPEKATYWEKVAASRWGQHISEIEEQSILRAHQISGKPGTALEIGCEGGRWSKLLSDLGWSMICTDVNKDVLEICQKRVPSARIILVQPDDKSILSETASLGLLLCIEVSPVINSEWFLPEAYRTLSDKGLIVGTFSNRFSLRGLFVNARDKLRSKSGYKHYQLSYSHWKKKMCNLGFKVIYERGFCWFPFGRASNSSLIPIFTFIERRLHLGRLVSLSPWIIFIAQKDTSQRAPAVLKKI